MGIKKQASTVHFDVAFTSGPDQENATTLTILLKLAIDWLQPDPTSAATEVVDAKRDKFKIQSWSDADKKHYWRRFTEVVEDAWNNRLFLVLPKLGSTDALSQVDYAFFQYSTRSIRDKNPPFIRCSLRLQSVEQQHTHHALLHLARLDAPKTEFRQFIKFRPNLSNEGVLSDTSTRRISKGFDMQAEELFQHPAAHEVGHLLGLDHPNMNDPGCKKGSEPICYGGDVWEQRDIRGLGEGVDAGSAGPWLKGIELLVGSSTGWKAIHWDPTLAGFD